MRAHFFQHESFEDLAAIKEWLDSHQFETTATKFYQKYVLPDLAELDWLIIMGGPMGVYEEDKYPWLSAEKKFIAEAIKQNKVVIGICLGAQLIAAALGGRVYKNQQREIGWFPITKTAEGNNSSLLADLPQELVVFHWHGDTFDLPPGAVLLASSAATRNQIFSYGERVIGFQCHLESTEKSVNDLIENCAEELVEGKYIQNVETLKHSSVKYLTVMRNCLFGVLDRLR